VAKVTVSVSSVNVQKSVSSTQAEKDKKKAVLIKVRLCQWFKV